jgi:hypothetical protein
MDTAIRNPRIKNRDPGLRVIAEHSFPFFVFGFIHIYTETHGLCYKGIKPNLKE